MEHLSINDLLIEALSDVDQLPAGFAERLNHAVAQPGDRPLAIQRLLEEFAGD